MKLPLRTSELSIPEALQMSPEELSELIFEGIDDLVSLGAVARFLMSVSEIDYELTVNTMKCVAEFAHITPRRLTLLEILKDTDLYIKSTHSNEDTEYIECPFLLDSSDLANTADASL